jgi:hypothetical protein
MARDQVLTIKVSAEEKARIKAAAKANHRTYSDWSRLVLLTSVDQLGITVPTDAPDASGEGRVAAA